MYTSQELSDLLRSRGYKVTPQRLAVYEALASEKWHPTAEMLYNRLQKKFPTMSFATVYKSVEIFHDIHVIQILNTCEDSFRYDADMSDHYHVSCVKCGELEDAELDGKFQQQLKGFVETQSSYQVLRQQLYFLGLCPRCQRLH